MALKRSSVQKRMIHQVLARADHPTAAEVYEYARRDCPNLSLGTVYRNLAAMAEAGEVLRLSFAGRPDRFDPNTHDHFHVVCNECGRIFDTDDTLSPQLLAELDRAIESSTGVRVEKRTLHFSGTCELCGQQAKVDPQSKDAAWLAKPVVNGAEAETLDYRRAP